MSIRSVAVLLGSMMLAAGLILGCGSSSTVINSTAPTPSPASLTGNWLLAGHLSSFPNPTSFSNPNIGTNLSAAIFVSGQQVTAQGYLQVQCSASSGFGELVLLSGSLANDGTFTLTIPSSPVIPTFQQLSIAGHVPTSASSTSWAGRYIITYPSDFQPSSSLCSRTQTAALIATPIPPLSGIYAGPASTFQTASGSIGSNATLSLSVEQETPIFNSGPIPSGNPVFSNSLIGELPLTATITVTGSPCFTSGTTVAEQSSNVIGGGIYLLNLTMNDGSVMFLSGTLGDATLSTVGVNYRVSGGACDTKSGETTLTRS